MTDIRRNYPYCNQPGDANHFYVACHSIGRSAMEKAEVRLNAIQVVCSSNYFISGYVAHKDASLPQIWPGHGTPPNIFTSKRARLAFFSGSVNSPICKRLVEAWGNDSEIFVHAGHVTTPYKGGFLTANSVSMSRVLKANTARIGDTIYFGCVAVIIANHYDLPFAGILNWKSFSVVVATLDIPLLKNVLEVRKHFSGHHLPIYWLLREFLQEMYQHSSDFHKYILFP